MVTTRGASVVSWSATLGKRSVVFPPACAGPEWHSPRVGPNPGLEWHGGAALHMDVAYYFVTAR